MLEQMKSKNFALLLFCIILTGLFVCFFGDPKPSFRQIVSKTHQKLSNLKNLKVPVVIPEEREPRADDRFLKSLGFTASPRLYPTHIWRNATLPVVVTSVSSGQGHLAVGFLRAMQTFLPDYWLLIYNLDLDSSEHALVSKHCNATNCTFRTFNYNFYPSHVGNMKLYAHRPLIIQEALDQAGAVLWMDVQYQVTSSMSQNLQERALRVGLLSWADHQPTSSLTHPSMFRYFHTQPEKYFFHRMVESGPIFLYNLPVIHKQLMLPWVQCALTPECISPYGAQNTGCRFDKKPLYRYSGCHRYDISALNVVLGRMFSYEATNYLADTKDKFFRKIVEDYVQDSSREDSSKSLSNVTQGGTDINTLDN